MSIKDPKNSVRDEQFSGNAENSFNEPEKDENKKGQQDTGSNEPGMTEPSSTEVSDRKTGHENAVDPAKQENTPPKEDSGKKDAGREPDPEKEVSSPEKSSDITGNPEGKSGKEEEVKKNDVTPGEPVETQMDEEEKERPRESVEESQTSREKDQEPEEDKADEEEEKVEEEEKPSGEDQAPKATGEKTSGEDQASKATDEKTAVEDQASKATGEKPSGEDQASKVTGEKPSGEDQTSKATGEKPSGEDQAPKATGEKPSGEDQVPKATGEKPSGEDQASKDTGEKSFGEDQAPKATDEKTAVEDQVPKATGEKPSGEDQVPKATGEKPSGEDQASTATDEKTAVEDKASKATGEKTAGETAPKTAGEESVNYSLLDKKDLVKMLRDMVSIDNIRDIKNDVEEIKTIFYKKHEEDVERQKKKYVENGGDPDAFEPDQDPDEMEMRDLLRKYRDLRNDYEKLVENDKDVNLRKKYQIIDEIKDLINRDESINKTFQEFRDLQKRWHEIGVVPQKELKNLWENYHYHVEKFYDYIKINKELRDLDLKKNLEAKLDLCEKAEALLLEPNVVSAFQTLQKYHDQWREIGPVPKDKRTELWERFREATAKINKRHQQYYHDLKETQKKNLESKTLLCEKAEELAEGEYNEHEQWVKKTRDLLELQKVWKTIGFAPKKDNNKIYARFRSACDMFFEKKREFYAQSMEEQQKNMQLKLDLCVQAEALQDSEDWRGATDELIRLQKKWKKIGPVPRKHSDELWKRFRGACDHFFNRKSDFFSKIDTTYEKNLEMKEALIKEIREFELGDNLKQNLKKLNDFQRRWAEIGFVPIEKKDEIMQNYREAINEHYDNLEMDDYKKNMLKFKNKVENIRQKPRSDIKLRFEREKLMNKLQQLKGDIGTWENNIGFFADSENADSMVKDFEKKIKAARDKIKLLEDKIILIDELDTDED